MVWFIVEVVLGCGLIAFAGDRFVTGSVNVAKRLRWPPLLAGVLLVGFGTSFPELVVSFLAALKHHSILSIGNAIGSNMVNIGLVVGLVALIKPIKIHRLALRRDLPALLIVSVLVGAVLMDHVLSRRDGVLLLVMLMIYLGFLFLSGRQEPAVCEELEELASQAMPLWKSFSWWGFGLVLLFISSDLLIHGAVGVAHYFHLSDLVIGSTVLAVGTSLPELVTTLMSALRGHHDIALGNVLGSNVYNLLAVVAMPALLSPTALPNSVLKQAYPVMLLFVSVLALMMRCSKEKVITRWHGTVLFLGLVGYMGFVLLR